MKRSPEMQRLEEILRSSKLAMGGFLGDDDRPIEEILDHDAAVVARSRRTLAEIANRMRDITAAARLGQETTVRMDRSLEAVTTATRGVIPCPWPHAERFPKTVTTVTHIDTGQSVRWSDLSIHMIEAHGFFQGRGSAFRIEPQELIDILF